MNRAPNRPRVMTLSVQPVADFRVRYSRWSGLFPILEQRYELLFGDPELTAAERWRGRLRHLHPRRSTVEARVGFSEDTFARRSRHAERALTAHGGNFDVILQLQTLFAPGLRQRPYVIYSDTTFAQVRREWPAWAPVAPATARRFAELERGVSCNAHTIFAMSEHARRSFVHDYGCDPERVVNVGTAIALPAVDLQTRSWSDPIALFVGLDFERKGGADLLAAWPAVRAAVPRAQLQIVGPRRAPRDLPDGVEWLGRVQDRERLAQIYRRAALFVLPTRFDPMPWVIGEAMGSGLAVLATPSCGIPEVIHDGVNGRLVAIGDRDELSHALAQLLADPARCEQLGRRAQADILASSRWDDVADRMAPRLTLAAGQG